MKRRIYYNMQYIGVSYHKKVYMVFEVIKTLLRKYIFNVYEIQKEDDEEIIQLLYTIKVAKKDVFCIVEDLHRKYENLDIDDDVMAIIFAKKSRQGKSPDGFFKKIFITVT